MSSHPKWLRQAAEICRRARLVNVANTCDEAAVYIETLERKRKIPSPELGSDHEQVDCSDPATCQICNAVPTSGAE